VSNYNMKIKKILTPYFLDSPLPGLEALKGWDWIINRPTVEGSSQLEKLSVIHSSLANAVQEISARGDLPVSIAGDCCSAIPVLAGLRRSGINPLLIWFDAHGDFNTWETTPSGFLGGMPLAMLVGKGEQTLLENVNLGPIAEDRVILTDARDLDPGEEELVARSKVTRLADPLDLLDYSFSDQALWIHFDTDVLDPEYVRAQNYSAPGGPSPEELGRVFQHLAATGDIAAVSLSSWAPDLPGAEESREISLSLLEFLCG
jgi:arginase